MVLWGCMNLLVRSSFLFVVCLLMTAEVRAESSPGGFSREIGTPTSPSQFSSANATELVATTQLPPSLSSAVITSSEQMLCSVASADDSEDSFGKEDEVNAQETSSAMAQSSEDGFQFVAAAAKEPSCTDKLVKDDQVSCGWMKCKCWASCKGSRYWYATSGLYLFAGYAYENCDKNCSAGLTNSINKDLGMTDAWDRCVSISLGTCPTDGPALRNSDF